MLSDGLTDDRLIDGDEGVVAASLTRREGPVKGRILFVNGALTTATALKWAVRALSDFELVLFDFPMIGRSRPLNPGACIASPEQDARVVRRLIDHYRPDYLISLSWGGTATLLALADRPASVRRAIVSSYSCGMSGVMRSFCETLVSDIEAGRRERAADLAARGLGEGLNARLQQHYRDYFLTLDPDQDDAIVANIRQVATLETAPYLSRLTSIDVPVLFANGSLDRYTPPEGARPFADLVPRASFETVEGSGHFLANEGRHAQAATCEVIRRWWAPEEARLVAAE